MSIVLLSNVKTYNFCLVVVIHVAGNTKIHFFGINLHKVCIAPAYDWHEVLDNKTQTENFSFCNLWFSVEEKYDFIHCQ